MKKKICHMSSVHRRYDIRIFQKQCRSIAKEDYIVYFLVADGKGTEKIDNINIIDVGVEKNRLQRMIFSCKKILSKAIEIDADVYHFHDPELIRVGGRLLKKNKKVIYDVHEDVGKSILYKNYLFSFLKPILAFLIDRYEKHYSSKFSAVITATDAIKRKLILINANTFCIYNYPLFEKEEQAEIQKENEILYIGGISKARGIYEIVTALEKLDCKLNLAGEFESQVLWQEIIKLKGWEKVIYHGFTNKETSIKLRKTSKIGLVIFHPEPNHVEAQPNKIFEYMNSELPLIGSNFPLWRDIIEKNKCGICINPLDSDELVTTIKKMINNKALLLQMGENGKKIVKEKYNWKTEEKKLYTIYKQLKG